MLLKFNRNYTSSNLTQSLEVDEKLILKTYGKTYEEIKAETGVLFIIVKKGKSIVYVQKVSGSEPVIKYIDKAFLNLPDEWYKFVCLKVCYASGATYEIASGEIDFNNEVSTIKLPTPKPNPPTEPDPPTEPTTPTEPAEPSTPPGGPVTPPTVPTEPTTPDESGAPDEVWTPSTGGNN